MSELRYGFGANWRSYVDHCLNDAREELARNCLLDFLGCSTLQGKTFLDIGCGSGIHSLAAHKAGCAEIVSFDFDGESVECAKLLHERCGSPSNWRIVQGSVLDAQFMNSLPQFDVVYAWGVLHHTGDQWKALEYAQSRVKTSGDLYLALYTSEMFPGWRAPFWLAVKKFYASSPRIVRVLLEWAYAAIFFAKCVLKGTNPMRLVKEYSRSRGMNFMVDIRDWLGGWPMEFSSINDVVRMFCRDRSFVVRNLKFGEANTEYLFRRLEERSSHT